jgi:16S rRNA (guanine966-N2)-methyltransferase
LRSSPRPTKSTTTNRLRINAGEWRSRVITFPDADGLRPTGDRVRQTLFNWLGQTLHGKVCLDAFAGSGALGFEAASRGAAHVHMCETQAVALKALRANAETLQATQCEIHAQDVITWLASSQGHKQQFDIAFCDPPFAANLHVPFLRAIASHMKDDGMIYVEAATPLADVVSRCVRHHPR